MEVLKNLKYMKTHEWILVEGNIARVGISDYAQHALGDVVFIELPEVGTEFEIGQPFGVVESVKAVSDVYSPVKGTILSINESLLDSPELVNQAPYDAWMIEVEVKEVSNQLLLPEEYETMISEEE